jgi:hypothetical protein
MLTLNVPGMGWNGSRTDGLHGQTRIRLSHAVKLDFDYGSRVAGTATFR